MIEAKMKKIIIGSGLGKTTKLIELSAKSGDYIVCHTQDEAYRVQNEANKRDLKIPFPITYNEFLHKQYHGRNIQGFLIDNADMLLESLTNISINAITITK